MKKLIGAPQAPPGHPTRLAHVAALATMGVESNLLGTRLADDTPHFGNTGIGGATGNMGTPT